ncbi:hypothetical protein ASPCAL07432 [Aspergillus calidoustus]|uniref:Uncharacterized protein n=1 Tax=Aspergillus calidoustus TaxID=454130 RepID=A0A0U5G3P9_ASPCI|nr:hypothetical protein ASPCAL07432 [Aspergillus calidoustus]
MRSLTICLPIHPTEVLRLDEDTRADLVNRFGRNVRRVLSIYVVQSSSLLKGARKGGHIRWHILKTETAVLSSDFRDGCLKTYSVSVTIDQSVLGVVPDFLDDSELSKLGREVGDDFDDIRKLSWDQLVCFLQWVQEAKMIESFEVQDNKLTAEMEALSGNYDTDLSLCTPPAFINPNLLTMDGTSPSYENFPPHAVDGVDGFDPGWNKITKSLEDQSNAEFATPEHVATPMGPGTSPTFDASTYPTPSHSINSPRAGVLASSTSPADGITQYRSTSTPFSDDSPYLSPAMTPTGLATLPGSNTPYVTSPPALESLTSPSLSFSSQRKLLESYRFGKDGTQFLEKSENDEILKAETGLLTQGPFRPLQPFLGLSEADASSSLSALGLPVKWTGKEGAVNYYKLLEAEKDNELVLCPFAKHIAQSLFYLNYRWLDKHIKRVSRILSASASSIFLYPLFCAPGRVAFVFFTHWNLW